MAAGSIDDADPTNRDFLEKRRGMAPPPGEPGPLHMIRPDPGEPEPEIPDIPGDEEEENCEDLPETGEAGSMYLLQKQKLSAEIRKKHREISLLQLREDKIRGEVIPVELVKNLFRSHTQAIVTAQKDGIEDLLIQISAETRMKGDQLARLRGKMVAILNTGTEKSVAASKRNLRSIISVYSLKREAGERG